MIKQEFGCKVPLFFETLSQEGLLKTPTRKYVLKRCVYKTKNVKRMGLLFEESLSLFFFFWKPFNIIVLSSGCYFGEYQKQAWVFVGEITNISTKDSELGNFIILP